MKLTIVMAMALLSLSAFATDKQVAKECVFLDGDQGTATIAEELSTDKTVKFVYLDVVLVDPDNASHTVKFSNIIMMKNLDDSTPSVQYTNFSQSTKGSKVTYVNVGTANEKFTSEVILAADGKAIKSVKFKQKTYNSYLDLAFPLNVKKIECKF